jgi:NitT/TauT family transport system substrate-binding protein
VQLRWTHQAQFAGFYAADQNGYYAGEGLAVKFVEGAPAVDFVQPVLDATAQFGIANADALIVARAKGEPVRALATLYRRNPTVLISLASSGLTRPQDFIGKTIQAGNAGRPLLQTMLGYAGLRPDQYTVTVATPDLAPLYSGAVQGRLGLITNEALSARAAGYTLNLIFPDNYGVHFYADTIFATDDLVGKNPDLVRRFLRATLKGWSFAVENPGAVTPLVLHYNPKADSAHETAFMAASVPLVATGEDQIGWMRPEVWAGMERILRDQGVLTQPVDVRQVYTMQFLNEIYGK